MLLLILEDEGMSELHLNKPPLNKLFDKPPEKMYKYTSFRRAFNMLTDNKIYFSKFSEFNDPFDGLMTLDLSTDKKKNDFIASAKLLVTTLGKNWTADEKQEQEFVNNQVEVDAFARTTADELREESIVGFCCLTKTSQSLPMWAHYADNHTGCCLIFDFSKYSHHNWDERFPFHHMKRIKYQKNLPTHELSQIWHYYAHKSHEWKYEQEWRAVMFKNAYPSSFLTQASNGAGFYELNNFLCGVILGYKMEDAYKEVIKAVARQRDIYVQQASRKLYEYGIEIL